MLKELREKQGKTQFEVAHSMGLSLTAYRNKENGQSKVYLDELEAFAEAIEMDLRKVVELAFFSD